MSSKYIYLIFFYIFTTSCIISVFGLTFEGVKSNDDQKSSKSQDDKGKSPSESTQNPDEATKKFLKTGVEQSTSSSASSSSNVISTEKALHFDIGDALDNVSKNLKIKDLMLLGSVCKSWNEVAARELETRGLERALLPDTYNTDVLYLTSNFLADVLHAKPHVGVLFVGPCNTERNCEELEDRIVVAYRRFFPEHLVAIGVSVSMMDETVITSCPTNLASPNGILGLFIPVHQALQVKASSCVIWGDITQCATQMINEVMIDSNQRSTIILLSSGMAGIYGVEVASNLIKNRLAQQSYSLWGGTFNDTIIHSKVRHSTNNPPSALFALNLSGKNLRSWSIVLNCRTSKHEFDQRLLRFKNSLNLARHSIGLVCGPQFVDQTNVISPEDMYSNNNELMAAVKKVFPNIPFIGIFNIDYFNQIGVDSMSGDDNQELLHTMSLSLMIVSNN